jgi:hypothetical protein
MNIPAFPAPAGVSHITEQGMTLRDYFAAKAMQGMLANPKLEKQILLAGKSWIEESAWAVADAMLKTREE